jgi:WD40 repeat protein
MVTKTPLCNTMESQKQEANEFPKGSRDCALSEVRGCAISPSGDTIVSASRDQTLKVWDASTWACLSTLYVNGWLFACVFHPDGEHIVAAVAGGVYFLRWLR